MNLRRQGSLIEVAIVVPFPLLLRFLLGEL